MLKSAVIAAVLIFKFNVYAAERVILLAPAAADIMDKLGCADKIVGKTKSVEEFGHAVKVGSHIRPNLEIIMSLKPDLIIVSSNRFFTEEMAAQTGVPVAEYNPETIDEILSGIIKLGELMNKSAEAERLTMELRKKLEGVHTQPDKPSVLYEIMQLPYTVAGRANIVTDIIQTAGGNYLIADKKKLVRYSLESAVAASPDFYIYQVGPMNKEPVPPAERPSFQAMNPHYLQVDEKTFSRANTLSFDNVLILNKLFNKEN